MEAQNTINQSIDADYPRLFYKLQVPEFTGEDLVKKFETGQDYTERVLNEFVYRVTFINEDKSVAEAILFGMHTNGGIRILSEQDGRQAKTIQLSDYPGYVIAKLIDNIPQSQQIKSLYNSLGL